MKRCPICNEWHTNDTDICPECGTELERNEVSSEDGDDGCFQMPEKEQNTDMARETGIAKQKSVSSR